jgi:hypothetical protein
VDGHHPRLALPGAGGVLGLPLDLDFALRHGRDEDLQIPGPAILRGQSLGQECVGGVLTLRAHARVEALSHRAAGDVETIHDPAEEVERRRARGRLARPGKKAVGAVPLGAFARAADEGAPQGPLAAVGEVEQRFLADIAERPAQNARQGEIVVGEAREPGQGQQVLEHPVFGKLQTVGAAHRHTLPLEGPDDLVEQGRPPPDQDQHVAIAARAHAVCFAIEHAVAGRHHLDDRAGDAPGQTTVRAFVRFAVDRRPGVGLDVDARRFEGPKIDAAGRVPTRLMFQPETDHVGRFARDESVERLAGAKHRVDERQNLRGGAPALVQHGLDETKPRVRNHRREALFLDREALGRGALEREDRLLLVGDGEYGAAHRSGAQAAEKLRRQGAKDVPLLGRRVLALVQQDMLEAAVELEEHPRGIGLHGQQPMRIGDQVGEIQAAARDLGAFVQSAVSQGERERARGVLRHGRRQDERAGI